MRHVSLSVEQISIAYLAYMFLPSLSLGSRLILVCLGMLLEYDGLGARLFLPVF